MSIESLKSLIPDYARDIRLNLSSLAEDETLNAQQKWGTFLAAALAARSGAVIREIGAVAKKNLSPTAYNAVKSAHAVMAMNNIYYKFVGIMKTPEYTALPAKLRMNAINDPGVDKVDFELWALTVSIVNACPGCIKAHEKTLADHGITREQVQTAARIAAVIHAAAAIIESEETLSGGALCEAA